MQVVKWLLMCKDNRNKNPEIMKALLLLSVLSIWIITLKAQVTNPNYDSTLVQKLKADEYGMKQYIFVILKTGENKTSDKSFIDSCFAGHMANMGKLVELNKLVVAGPFGKNDNDFRGLFILNVATIEEAEILLQTDPAVKEKLLMPELYRWYGSAALPEYLDEADKIWKVNP